MNDGAYESIDKTWEYLDLSGRKLGAYGVYDIFHDVAEDTVLKQLNINYNIPPEDVYDRKEAEQFFRKLRKLLVKNERLTAIDIGGNNLFLHHPHPMNEHLKTYELELIKILSGTKVTHLDISDNNVTGHTGRELAGCTEIMKFMSKRKALKCKLSKLSSQGFHAISNCLGRYSSLTFLDISHNCGGLDPGGTPTTDGVSVLAQCLSQSLHVRVLKVAHNFLSDECIVLIAEAIHNMPQFQDLDVAGNSCRTNGARALKKAIVSHNLFEDKNFGLRHIDISNNPLGDSGAAELAFGIKNTHTVQSLQLRFCDVAEDGMAAIREGLSCNCSIRHIDLEGNVLASQSLQKKAYAEVQAVNHIFELKTDPMAVNAGALSRYEYLALAKKLHYLSPAELIALHSNESFNEPESIMQESLHLLEPPPRHILIEEVRSTNKAINARLKHSHELERQLRAAEVVYRAVMTWYAPIQAENNLFRALEAARKNAIKKSAHNVEDDMFKKY